MKKRMENVVGLYDSIQMTNESSVVSDMNAPVIKDMYDPLSGLHDGTITPNAPIVVIGEDLCPPLPGKVHWGLSPAGDKERFIEIRKIYKYTDIQLLMLLPKLEPGEYFLVMKVCTENKADFIYPLPILPWRVVEEKEVDMFAGSMRRNSRFYK